ncbi:Ldh family oxidoreductase [Bordetella petrii]|uniref:Malate dehydrogenase n=1 Tax=Bordetella petrii (strain ATCC BAA-461 / DSM 12804 / CCUG 43448 / CIP 107267 / Se-1111R) TaxID=340100 RepID=A9IDR2_BORPD|nr:Ldh family oxidoreductase [Bordetella petrii]CAP41595.1 Malate dehydrogenase [Bordetella petrii]
MSNTEKSLILPIDEVLDLATRVLLHAGMAEPHAKAIARVITAGQRDDCQSHGLYRLLVTTHTLRQGKVSGTALPLINDHGPAIVKVDAQFAFSQLAFELGSEVLVKKAREVGIAALAINNCYHFSALWPEVESLAEQGLAALALTPSHAWVAPAGGTRPALGTNPLAFGWPRKGKNPYVFDFATSAAARGDLELHRRADKPIPLGWGVDSAGNATTDASAVVNGGAMLTFGGHKGSALSTMIELMAGPLIGDLTSLDSLALDAGVGGTPCHGELIIALDPAHLGLGDSAADDARAERLFSTITDQGARLPSQRRFEARARSQRDGVAIPRKLYSEVMSLLPAGQ